MEQRPGAISKLLLFVAALPSLPFIVSWLVATGIIVALLFVLYMTFVPVLPIEFRYTLDNYERVLFDAYLWRVMPNTVIVGFGTVAVAAGFGIPLAWLLNRTDVPGRSFWISMIIIMPLIPGFLRAMGWIMLLNPRIGLINEALTLLPGITHVGLDVQNVWGIAFVQGLILTPIFFFLLAGPIRSLDPALEEAAQVGGLTTRQVMRHVTFPVLWPSILGGAIYVFMTAIALFEIAAILGGLGVVPVLATEMMQNIFPRAEIAAAIPRYGVAGIYGAMIALPSIVALIYYRRAMNKSYRYAVVTGKGYRPKVFHLGSSRWLGLGFVLLFMALAVILPLAVLVWTSLLPRIMMPSAHAFSSLTFEYYSDIMRIIGGPRVIMNTIIVTVSAAVLVIVASVMISWVVVRTNSRSRGVLDIITLLPHAVPNLAFAFGLLMISIVMLKYVSWLAISGTIWIIILANVFSRISFGTRITNAALVQIDKGLEEAAYVSGLGRMSTIRRILIPLIWPSVVFGAIWSGMLVFSEVTMAFMLSSRNNQVLSTRLFSEWIEGNLNEAAALGVVMVLVMGLIMFALLKAGIMGRRMEDS